jgi:hypothetical protein
VLDFYKRVWPQTPGYMMPYPDLLELPTWVAHLNASVKDPASLEFLYADRQCRLDTLPLILPYYDKVYGSVLDVSRFLWSETARLNPESTFILGGYCEPLEFPNVEWQRSLPPETNYSIFAGMPCVPRLALSSGCLYNCSFCTIARQVKTIPHGTIFRNVNSFEPLKFELVYLDDKTFGQAENWKSIKEVFSRIRTYNPDFKGFIVQSTAHEVIKHAQEWIEEYHVQYVECGVESLDQSTLSAWRKPHGVRQILQATETMVKIGGKRFIPNVIFGVARDSRGVHNYGQTIEYLQNFSGVMPFFNPYFLCQYHDSKGKVSRFTTEESTSDLNETSKEKSWLTFGEQELASRALDQSMELF